MPPSNVSFSTMITSNVPLGLFCTFDSRGSVTTERIMSRSS